MLFTFPSRYWFTIGLSGVFSLTGWCRLIHTGFLRSRATQDHRSRIYACFRVRGYHPLRLNFPDHSTNILYPLYCKSYNPTIAVTTVVWASPRSLATTCGITLVFFSSGYLDGSVPRVRLPICMIRISRPTPGWVVPFGYLRLKGYLHLTEAFRSLSRPSSPLRAKASTVCS